MKITKTVEHKIRMGEYESLTVGVTVELDVPEGVQKDAALDELDGLVDAALAAELNEAREICDTNSYITDWRK